MTEVLPITPVSRFRGSGLFKEKSGTKIATFLLPQRRKHSIFSSFVIYCFYILFGRRSVCDKRLYFFPVFSWLPCNTERNMSLKASPIMSEAVNFSPNWIKSPDTPFWIVFFYFVMRPYKKRFRG